MNKPDNIIHTIPGACRVCYTCVRECPTKAISVKDGQAEIVSDRCILCGNCVMVCSQNAKQVTSIADSLGDILEENEKVVAIVAPSFPAEFEEFSLEQFVGALKAIGFDYVVETAFGADLVAAEYKKAYADIGDDMLVATPCPAIVSYIEKFRPKLVEKLAHIVSPMIATAKVSKKLYGSKSQVVFIGPCIAKKSEAMFDKDHSVKAVLTFKELRELFVKAELKISDVTPQDFDPPHSSMGALFPLTRGVVQSAEIGEGLLDSGVISIDGKHNLRQFSRALIEDGIEGVKLVDALCCEGCIMGPGMTTKSSATKRRQEVLKYAQKRFDKTNREQCKEELKKFDDIDLSIEYQENDQRISMPPPETLRSIMVQMGKTAPQDELNCTACGYATCLDHANAIYKGLAENEMCLPYTIDRLKKTAEELNNSNVMLKETQEALQHSEKMASMGRLSAGIAHEINNPLGVILLYSNLLKEECDKFPGFKEDLEMIIDQTQVCQKIVGGLLDFSHKDRVSFQEVDIVNFIDKITRVIIRPKEVFFVKQLPTESIMIEMDSSQFTQVVTNVINNAVEVMPDGGEICFKVTQEDNKVQLNISDTGPGIEESIRARIFEPFFTTKTIGQGTGLGLAVSYGIVKNHKGTIEIESNTDFTKGKTGTTFKITLPLSQDELH